MKTKDIKILHDEILDLLSELNDVASDYEYLLENDLETAILGLLLDNNYNKMTLVKSRVLSAIQKIKDGTFKVSSMEEVLLRATA